MVCRAPSPGPSRGAGPAPADRESAAADRRGARPNPPASAPNGRCSTAPPSARPRAPSGGSRRRWASRASPTAPGQPGTGRDEQAQRAAMRHSRSAAATPRATSSCAPRVAGDRPVRCRAPRTGPWRWRARRHHDASRTRAGPAAPSTVGQAPQQDPIPVTTQVTVLAGCSDHPKAGVSGDADVGEAKDEGYGHVDQAASSAVTSHPYRSNASAR